MPVVPCSARAAGALACGFDASLDERRPNGLLLPTFQLSHESSTLSPGLPVALGVEWNRPWCFFPTMSDSRTP